MPTIELNDTLKELNFDYLNKEYPGENELVWCERCKTEHRRGAPAEIEYARFISKNSALIASEIDTLVISELLKHDVQA